MILDMKMPTVERMWRKELKKARLGAKPTVTVRSHLLQTQVTNNVLFFS